MLPQYHHAEPECRNATPPLYSHAHYTYHYRRTSQCVDTHTTANATCQVFARSFSGRVPPPSQLSPSSGLLTGSSTGAPPLAQWLLSPWLPEVFVRSSLLAPRSQARLPRARPVSLLLVRGPFAALGPVASPPSRLSITLFFPFSLFLARPPPSRILPFLSRFYSLRSLQTLHSFPSLRLVSHTTPSLSLFTFDLTLQTATTPPNRPSNANRNRFFYRSRIAVLHNP